MTFLPIVERELRVRARLRATLRIRIGGALLASLFVALLLLLSEVMFAPGKVGRFMFSALGGVALGFCLLEGVRATADCLSEEKRQGTLGLLFLTDLKGYDVVLGKLAATSLNSFYSLIAIFPPLAVPITLGGVTGGEFWRLGLLLADTLFFSLATGMFVSSFSRRESQAWGTTLALILAVTILTAILPAGLWPGFEFWKAASPLLAFSSLFDLPYGANPERYWHSILWLHLAGWLGLALASFVLPLSWKEGGERRFTFPFRPMASGFGRVRPRQEKNRLLDLNPVLWLSGARSRPSGWLWLLVSVAGAVWIILWGASEGDQNIVWGLVLSALGLHFFLACWVAFRAAHAFTEARDSGALELLLTTPLTPQAIAAGHWLALHRSFLRPLRLLLFTEAALFLAELFVLSGTQPDSLALVFSSGFLLWMLAVSILDIYAAGHFGLWMGLTNKKPAQAVSKTILFVLVLPVLGMGWCPVAWIILPVLFTLKDLLFIRFGYDQLRRRFREIVAERFVESPAFEGADGRKTTPRSQKGTLPRVLPP
jgi:ABC-type transport system involved in multi-copper enzyme maturation permease subunit